MSEREEKRENLEAFREKFKAGLEETLELAEMFQETLPIDPYSMGIEERTFEELSPEEKIIARQVIFSELGLNAENLGESILREYITTASEDATAPGKIKVSVFKIGGENEGIFLQELTFSDGEKRWVVGPDQNI